MGIVEEYGHVVLPVLPRSDSAGLIRPPPPSPAGSAADVIPAPKAHRSAVPRGAVSPHGATLHDACIAGDTQKIEELVQLGVDLNEKARRNPSLVILPL